ncbi:MAG: beta-ketoacyl synthase N-terminal-like domain-containing protein [Deltaproteobacteria bacterium]|nr:beta-ketoacyl synthase N-terminal-like domain-containing protein [Deltaproteobacteria bacterium]
MKTKSFVTGKALTCSLGDSLTGIVAAVREPRLKVEQLPFTLAALPYTRPYYLIARNEEDRLENRSEAYFFELLFSTVSRALVDAGLSDAEIREMPLFFGSTSMDMPLFEERHRRNASSLSELFLQDSNGYGKIAGAIQDRFRMAGKSYSFITACTSSANALLYAAATIEAGRSERALVVGYDLYNNLGFYGFEGLKAVASSEYRPFDRARDGLILGEACGAVVLEGKKKKASDFACLGGANLCDTYSVTSHDEAGTAVADTMHRALKRTGIAPGEIVAVKAHATGTENNDRTESAAMKLVFGPQVPPVVCLKPFIGHTVGACGVSELVLLTESIKAGFIPGTPGFRDEDEALGLSPLRENTPVGEGVFMLNYFGFGGNCTTLILSNRGEKE